MLTPTRVIGNLVGVIARLAGHRLRNLVELGRAIIIQRGPVLPLHREGEGGAGFDGKFVERQMIRAKFQNARQFRTPRRSVLAGLRIDQIERNRAECSARQSERFQRIIRRMRPAKEFEALVVQRLEPKRQPIDARRCKVCKARRIVRVCLDRDFGAGLQSPEAIHLGDHLRDLLPRHQRRRAAAKEDGISASRARAVAPAGEVRKDGVEQGRGITRLGGIDVEVAIRADARAIRPVDVDAETAIRVEPSHDRHAWRESPVAVNLQASGVPAARRQCARAGDAPGRCISCRHGSG